MIKRSSHKLTSQASAKYANYKIELKICHFSSNKSPQRSTTVNTKPKVRVSISFLSISCVFKRICAHRGDENGVCTNSLWLTFTGKYFPGNTHLNSIIVFASAFDHWKGTQFRIILILTTSFSKENARGLNSHIIVITVLEKRYSQVSDPAFCTFFATFEELKTQFYTLILGMYSHIIHLYLPCASTKYFTDNIPFPWKWPML